MLAGIVVDNSLYLLVALAGLPFDLFNSPGDHGYGAAVLKVMR